jgi:hypothetical protein
LLHLTGGWLAGPDLGSWDGLEAWYDRRGAGEAVVGMVRLAALVASWWLALSAALQVVAATVRAQPVVTLADLVSPRFLRGVARGAASLSISAGLAVPLTATDLALGPPGTAIMVPLDAESTATSTTLSAPPPAPAEAPPAPAPPSITSEVVVQPGQSFWSIAVDQTGERNVVEYWRALIEANRDRLVDPANPDLVFAGQRFLLPDGLATP